MTYYIAQGDQQPAIPRERHAAAEMEATTRRIGELQQQVDKLVGSGAARPTQANLFSRGEGPATGETVRVDAPPPGKRPALNNAETQRIEGVRHSSKPSRSRTVGQSGRARRMAAP